MIAIYMYIYIKPSYITFMPNLSDWKYNFTIKKHIVVFCYLYHYKCFDITKIHWVTYPPPHYNIILMETYNLFQATCPML